MKIISTIALISINETLFIQMISFLIFLFIINRIMIRPLRSVMAQRETHIKNVQDEIVSSKQHLDSILVRMKEEEKTIRDEARVKQEEIQAIGHKEAEGIFDAAREQIHAEKEKALEQMNAQIESAKLQIKEESEVLATFIIEKVLERRLVQ